MAHEGGFDRKDMKTLVTYVPKKVFERLAATAEELGITKQEIALNAITKFLDEPAPAVPDPSAQSAPAVVEPQAAPAGTRVKPLIAERRPDYFSHPSHEE